MKVVSSECIILKHQDFRERDRLVTFLARDKGRMAGVARGARKLTARGLSTFEPFIRGTIFYTEKPGAELVSIRKCDPVPPYLQLQAGYDKFLYASYFTELVSLCRIGPQEAEPFFLLLAGGLENLYGAQSPQALPLLRLDYELDFLSCLGLQPQWGRCCACDRPLLASKAGRPQPLLSGRHQFDASLGGVRCPDCRAAGHALTELSAGSLAFLAAWRDGAARDNLRPTHNALAELEAALTQHIVHHLEREPRSLALLPRVGGPGSV
ncbi:MAG: DNA repair protein RecO [SAR324 cluster bacterium]|nr:DNA repair protein RecO [SAR324 cluster bacterium]